MTTITRTKTTTTVPLLFTRLIPFLPGICRILQCWHDDLLIDTLGQLLYGGDTKLAAETCPSRAAHMQLGLPTCLGGFGVHRSRDYVAVSHIALCLACEQPLSYDLPMTNP